ncbi:MAG: dienelactone hydrolase family protein [Burkholderiaceae bacterium]
MTDAIDDDLNSLLGTQPLPRRGFMIGSLASGFALSVAPTGALLAQTIHTDTAGLLAGEVAVPVADGRMVAYRAQPAGKTRLPTVLVVQEIFGVHEHIRDVCRRFAKLGYLAVAPELFARQGDPSTYKSIQDLLSNVVAKVPDAQVMSDLDATAAWAASHGGDPERLGITGFCWGGRIVWLYSAHNPRLKAGVAWYGALTRPATPLAPTNPYDVAGKLNAPVLGLYGGQDPGIPQDTISQMKARLERGSTAARQSQFIVYPDAEHAFNADYRPSYRKEAADDGWIRALSWFRRNGLG